MDKQISEMIGDIEIPVIVDDVGEKWYPINNIYIKLFDRAGVSGTLYSKLQQYTCKKEVRFSKNRAETNCISYEGLIRFIDGIQQKRLTIEQKKKLNFARVYCGLQAIAEIENYTSIIPKEMLSNYTDLELSLIENYKNDKKPVDYQFCLCGKCGMYYPMDIVFYNYGHNRFDTSACRKCKTTGAGFIVRDDRTKLISGLFGENDIHNITDKEIYEKSYDIYETIPDHLFNKEFVISAIGVFKSKNPDYNFKNHSTTLQFKIDTKLKKLDEFLNFWDVLDIWYGKDARYQPFRYDFNLSADYPKDKESLAIMFKYYLQWANISIDNQEKVCDEFSEFVRRYKIPETNYVSKLDFIVEFYEYKYPGYWFKATAQKYYDKDENVLFDFKKLVEEMNLEIPKIPIYITKNTLNTKYRPLYYAVMTNKRNSFNTLFDIFNTIYPSQFVELDFDRNFKREEFDSVEEKEVHDYLSEKLGKNLIYNIRDGSKGIKINGHMPDWILIKEKPVIIEYFGLTLENRETNNKRLNDYKEKTERKINAYRELECYNTLFIYPSDIKNNFEKLYDKLTEMELI